jgi:uncharacterized cupin superfamily protein
MPDKIQLKIYDIVGGPIWVSTEDGQKVYEKIVAAFKAGRAVELSFANRGNLITAFLNAAIGQLYNGDFTEEYLRENLTEADITDEDRVMLNRSIENAKRYFANRPAIDKAWKEEVGDEEK